ncbi:Cupredoxin [Aspergillus ambiguus]|uniref:multicopper oxidase abr1 n=1 Tax=Aspergillus ambiguus TaxID=176160 RepID=UPI003CCDAA22
MGIVSLVLIALQVLLVSGKDVYLNWTITWVKAAPDGYERPLIGINGKWPCPLVEADLGDYIIADVYNDLKNESTGIHWHGFHQYMTNAMDGANDVTQCAIPPGGRMRYRFMVNQSGTYWYHSHETGQFPDGLRGPLIVHDPSPPFQFDDEFTLTLSDYYHEQMPTLLQRYISSTNSTNPGGLEPIPDRTLINDSVNTTIRVEPNKTYLVHLVCIGNWPGHVIIFDQHDITVVEVDGTFTDPYPVVDKQIRLATGQRMSVLLQTKNTTDQNFAIWDSTDVNMMFFYENRSIPERFNPNATAWLVYDQEKPLPSAPDYAHLDPNVDFIDDVSLVPADHLPILEPVDYQIVLNTDDAIVDGTGRFLINGVTYRSPDTPTLFTAVSVDSEQALDPNTYGQVNPLVIEYGQIVEIIINNQHGNLHPWHLHGHQFQVIQRSAVEGGYFAGYFQNVSSTPIRRDTIMVQNHGHVVIRFRADNPDKSIIPQVNSCFPYGAPPGG